jgi:small-conductance mechanosensitive channel
MALGQLASNPTFRHAAIAAVEVAAVWLVARLASRQVMRVVGDTQTRYRLRKAVILVGYAVAALVVVLNFSESLLGIGVALGVVGAGVALGTRELVASVAGWASILLGHVYSTSDRIQVGSIKGDVIDIGMLRTTLMEVGEWVDGDLYNGRIVRVANSIVFREAVHNYSADFPFLWDEITVPVRYGSDWKLARTAMDRVVKEICDDYARESREAWQKAVRRYQLADAPIEPMITMVATDNWLEFTIRYVVDYRQRRATRHLLFTRLLEEVDRSEGRIRLASATFEVTGLPRLDVRLPEASRAAARPMASRSSP